MRFPDSSDGRVMTRRGWWLVVLNWLIPGSAQALAGSRRLGRFGLASTILLWVLVVLTVAGLLLWRSGTLGVLLNPIVLVVLGVLAIAYAVVWIILTLDTLRLVRLVKTRTPGRYLIVFLAVVLMVISGGTVAYAAPRMLAARNAIGSIFNSGRSVQPTDGYYNILLLGGDSSEGRDSMRFDSISVVSDQRRHRQSHHLRSPAPDAKRALRGGHPDARHLSERVRGALRRQRAAGTHG